MKILKYSIGILLVVAFTSCKENGNIEVQNKLLGATIEGITFAKSYGVGHSVASGQTSPSVSIEEEKSAFPITGKLSFFISSKGKSIYLETDEVFSLGENETLTIRINEDTPVSNPALSD